MKPLFCAIAMLLTGLILPAQNTDFAPVGAKWYYSEIIFITSAEAHIWISFFIPITYFLPARATQCDTYICGEIKFCFKSCPAYYRIRFQGELSGKMV